MATDLKIANCLWPRSDYRSVRINQVAIPQQYVNILSEAADHVKYIGESSNMKLQAQQVLDELPNSEELAYLKNNIEGCVSDIVNNVGDVGFIKDHHTGEYTYFVMINGERMEVSGINEFDTQAVIEVSREQFNLCSSE